MGFVMLGLSAVGAWAVDTSAAGLNGAAYRCLPWHYYWTCLFDGWAILRSDSYPHIPHWGPWKKMPMIAIFFLIAGFGSLGLPGSIGVCG
ncbi:MAG: hypothetical protein Ct9H300mP19_05040 [Dehalococcoidia bacterium]|nr:MAG: hypothetical protein Ct9H300mP19_05040 [Dehalococcoidia bacterium]